MCFMQIDSNSIPISISVYSYAIDWSCDLSIKIFYETSYNMPLRAWVKPDMKGDNTGSLDVNLCSQLPNTW